MCFHIPVYGYMSLLDYRILVGVTWQTKLSQVRQKLVEHNANALAVTILEESACKSNVIEFAFVYRHICSSDISIYRKVLYTAV